MNSSSFQTTHWTLVRQSRGDDTEAKQALSNLCAAYYAPVVAFIARSGFEEGRARDLAHDFFARVLSASQTLKADAERGRFRSYLLGAVRHFVCDTLDRERAQKRGGGAEVQAITETGLTLPDANATAPDRAFDRQWALTMLDRVLRQLADEFEAAGKAEHFDQLKPWLTGDDGSVTQAEIGQRLGMNEGAVKVAIHRLRKRFREMVKAEVAQTVGESEVREELDYLVAILGGGSRQPNVRWLDSRSRDIPVPSDALDDRGHKERSTGQECPCSLIDPHATANSRASALTALRCGSGSAAMASRVRLACMTLPFQLVTVG